MPSDSRPGQTLHTREHDKIRSWAEERGGQPATVPGTEHGDHLGVLRIDFPGFKGDNLRRVSWDEWFGTFDQRSLDFVYQEEKRDGTQSNFFRLVSPEREDA
jgi:hypothetical protein